MKGVFGCFCFLETCCLVSACAADSGLKGKHGLLWLSAPTHLLTQLFVAHLPWTRVESCWTPCIVSLPKFCAYGALQTLWYIGIQEFRTDSFCLCKIDLATKLLRGKNAYFFNTEASQFEPQTFEDHGWMRQLRQMKASTLAWNAGKCLAGQDYFRFRGSFVSRVLPLLPCIRNATWEVRMRQWRRTKKEPCIRQWAELQKRRL